MKLIECVGEGEEGWAAQGALIKIIGKGILQEEKIIKLKGQKTPLKKGAF